MALVTPAEMALLDPYYDSVVLLLGASGANNSAVFVNTAKRYSLLGVDQAQFAITNVGTPLVSTTQSKFGGTSLYLNGSSHLAMSSSATIVQAGDFTLECWFYATSNAYGYIYGNFGSNSVGNNAIAWSAGALTVYYAGNTGFGMTGASLSLNTWYHLALCRSGTTVTLYIDGVARGSGSVSGTWGTSSYDFRIGNTNWTNYWFSGYIDEFRITSGVARYSTEFTPPTQEYAWLASIPITSHGLPSATGLSGFAPTQALDRAGVRSIPHFWLTRNNVLFDGIGQITGTVKNTPATPVHRRVLLIDEATQQTLRQTWSDASTGVYRFANVQMGRTYTVLSYDHTLAFRAVVADRVLPELMTQQLP